MRLPPDNSVSGNATGGSRIALQKGGDFALAWQSDFAAGAKRDNRYLLGHGKQAVRLLSKAHGRFGGRSPHMMTFWQKHSKIIRYLFFGVLTTLLNYIAYYALTRWIGMTLVVANSIAWFLAVMFAYYTNRRWVFRSGVNGCRAVLKEFFEFVAVRLFSGIGDTGLLVVLTETFSLHDVFAKALVGVVVIVLNYVLSKLVVFRHGKW